MYMQGGAGEPLPTYYLLEGSKMNRRDFIKGIGAIAVSALVMRSKKSESSAVVNGVSGAESSYVKNCYIEPRQGMKDFVFSQDTKGRILAHLDGYAIIPIEEYKGAKTPLGVA